MAKAVKNFYWKGKWYKVGDEAPESAPSFVTEGEPAPKKEKVVDVIKTGSKAATPQTQDKNGAPKTANKGRKKRK